jgi:hypothetical protein
LPKAWQVKPQPIMQNINIDSSNINSPFLGLVCPLQNNYYTHKWVISQELSFLTLNNFISFMGELY